MELQKIYKKFVGIGVFGFAVWLGFGALHPVLKKKKDSKGQEGQEASKEKNK